MNDNYTYNICGDTSDNFSLIGGRLLINKKYHTWSTAVCGKHLVLSRHSNPPCRLCTQNKHVKDLEDNGLVVLDRLSSNEYLVKLKCGHSKVVPSSPLLLSLFCKDCRDSSVLNHCPDGTIIKSFTKMNQVVELSLPCGHTITRKTYSKDYVICLDCNKDKKNNVLGSLSTTQVGINKYKLACGHITGSICWSKLEKYKCPSCEMVKIQEKISSVGLTPSGNYSKILKAHEVILGCGHSRYLRSTEIKNGVICPICSDDHFNQKCSIYAIHFKCSNGLSFVKVGTANDVNSRIIKYKLVDIDSLEILSTKVLKTKREATKIEKDFHAKNKSSRISPAIVRDYMKCGFTECYPVIMIPSILSFISNIE